MSDPASAVPLSTRGSLRKNVPVVTVESFYEAHAAKLQLKLEGPHVGFHRKIREPTINRPGLALAGFYTYFAEKRVQVLGAAEQSYLESLAPRARIQRFRGLCAQKFPAWSFREARIFRANYSMSRRRKRLPFFAHRW